MLRYIVLACFALLVSIASFLAEDLFFPASPPFTRGTIELEISKDLKKLRENQQFPPSLSDLKQVFISDHRFEKTELNWPKLSHLYFPQKLDGKYDLQIEVFDSEADETLVAEDALIILQMSLFDAKSKNKILEISRSYKISELKK